MRQSLQDPLGEPPDPRPVKAVVITYVVCALLVLAFALWWWL